MAAALLSVMPLFLAACDGEGLKFEDTTTSGDNPPDQDGDDDGGNTPPPSGETDTRFTGSWVASYGDDFTTSRTSRGAFQYAAILRLIHKDTSITGSGYIYRFTRTGSQAWQKYNINVTGTASGTDATLVVKPSLSSAFDANPVWYIRLAGSRIVGMFQETTPSNELIRGGHAVWLKVATGTLEGAWAAAASDAYAVAGTDRLERTASMSISQADSELSGNGTFDLQRNTAAVPADFSITRGAISAPDIGFSFGELDLGVNSMDWAGFYTGSAIVAAYGEFDGADALLRMGHATWYRAPEPTTSAVTNDWVVSFSDAVTVTGAPGSDYLARMSLRAQDGGVVTGSGTVRVENDNTAFENFTVDNGTLIGSLLHLEMHNVTRTLIWDLRLAGTVMVGSYRELNGSGNFVSRGTGEWRPEGTPSLKGTWTTAYLDTYGSANLENTQLALVTISRQESNGALAGTGGLRFAGDTRRRLFNVDGDASGDEIIWTWRSQDLFGITTWHLRQAGNFLYGTYINEDSSGALEYRGNALWIRTNQTDVVTP
jgi:hypothetical protein